jgi:pyruvate kinase
MSEIPKTKIIATVGPSTWDEAVLKEMIDLGMTGARINASFADFEELKRVKNIIRKLSDNVALILDTQGHKIRLNKFDGHVDLVEGSTVSIGYKKGDEKLWINSVDIRKDIKAGDKILLDNGLFELIVENSDKKEIKAKVVQGGALTSAKTVNLPNTKLTFPSLTEKDIRDIEFAVSNGFDYISASFIRNSKDIETIKNYTMGSSTKLIAKIENQEGVDNFDEILEEADGIMIARGDLGVETDLVKVPILQKQMIRKCRERGKIAIVATHMLESMVDKNLPTRAEINDVANAVFDGADAVMLSAETSIGNFPVEATRWMAKACIEAESSCEPQILFGDSDASVSTDAVARSIIDLTSELPIKKIVVGCRSGNSVLSVSRHRPGPEILAFVNDEFLSRQLNIISGVRSIFVNDTFPADRDWLVRVLSEYGLKSGYLKPEDMIVLLTGSGIAGKSRNSILEVAKVFDICNV